MWQSDEKVPRYQVTGDDGIRYRVGENWFQAIAHCGQGLRE